MKLSTRSRYGTRLMLDLASRYEEGPVQIGEISKREDISVKYLEQLIIPLKKSGFVKSLRGPKGGHMLARNPRDITMGEVVRALEGGIDLTVCIEKPDECTRSSRCAARGLWEETTKVMYEKLDSVSLMELVEGDRTK